MKILQSYVNCSSDLEIVLLDPMSGKCKGTLRKLKVKEGNIKIVVSSADTFSTLSEFNAPSHASPTVEAEMFLTMFRSDWVLEQSNFAQINL